MALNCINNMGAAQFSVLIGFPIIVCASTALATDIPEFGFLFGLLLYYLISQRNCKVQWCGGGYQRLMDSVATLPKLLTVILVGVPLTLASIHGVPEIGFAMSGGIAYFVIYSLGQHRRKASTLKCKGAPPAPAAATRMTTHRHATLAAVASSDQSKRQLAGEPQRESSAVKAQLARPAVAAQDAEVQDIVRSGLPTASDELVVRQIVNHVRKSVLPIVPEAEIVGRAVGNLAHVGAQGLKPEVDIVVMASPEVLTERLRAFYLKGPTGGQQKSMATLLPDVLQKTATRVLSERLRSLRFWRSQFTGPEPRVVLLAPAELGFSQYPIRINFYVNNPYPQRLSMVLAKGDVRCKELALLVTHWANIRGINNTAKGHLHSYAYSLLVVYFLRGRSEGDLTEKATVELFGDFVRFYRGWFDQSQSDAVTIRFGAGEERLVSAESKLFGIPSIIDPFATAHNVASAMTGDGVARLKEELARASRIMDACPRSLETLLERWSPQTNPEEQ